MKRTSFRWGVVALFLLPIILLAFLMFRKIEKITLYKMPVLGFVKQANRIEAEWANLEYFPISGDTFTNQLASSIGSSMGRQLCSDVSASKFLVSLENFFHAYHNGDYRSYRSFRLPRGITPIWTNQVMLDEWLSELKVPSTVVPQLSPEKKFYAMLIAVNGDRSVFSNYFVGVNFKYGRIVFKKCTKHIPELTATKFFSNDVPVDWILSDDIAFPNAGYIRQDAARFVNFPDSAIAVLNSYGDVLVADAFFFVKRREPYKILPIVIRFYWDPNSNQWLPENLLAGDVLLIDKKKDRCWPVF